MVRDVQHRIEPNLHREMVTLIRSVHTSTTPAPDRENPSVEAFLRSDPPPLSVFETVVEVPIFPRGSWPGFKDGLPTSSAKTPRTMRDVHCLAPAVEIEEEDLSLEHMRVVDGWSTCRSY